MDDHRSLNDDLFDAAMKEALRQIAQEEELEAERLFKDLRDEASAVTPSPKFQSNLKYLCAKAGKRKAPVRIYPRAARMAAAFALVVGIGAAAAVGVDAYRNSLFGWVFRQDEIATTLEQKESLRDMCSAAVFDDTGWDSYYFPSYLPKGFQLEIVDADFISCSICFKSNDLRIIIDLTPISEDILHTAMYDTEGTSGFKRIILGDYECYFVKKKKITQVVCNNGDFWLEVYTDGLPKQEAFRIMESMEKLKN